VENTCTADPNYLFAGLGFSRNVPRSSLNPFEKLMWFKLKLCRRKVQVNGIALVKMNGIYA
jgi:hypothetical protein